MESRAVLRRNTGAVYTLTEPLAAVVAAAVVVTSQSVKIRKKIGLHTITKNV